MLEVGSSEMLVIAVVMIVVVGPKDLPGMLRTFGRTAAKLRGMAGDFQKQFNEALQEAELDDLKKSVDELRGLNPKEQIRKHLNPFEQAAADVRAGLSTLKPQSSPQPSAEARPAEPLKAGPVETPDLPSASAALASQPPVMTETPPDKPAAAGKAAAKPKAKAPEKPKAAGKAAAKTTKAST
jgi:sec-independent protein translocase protein TatB